MFYRTLFLTLESTRIIAYSYTMEPALHRYIYGIERDHWWYAGRRRIIFDVIARIFPDGARRALDIGCGSGLNAAILSTRVKEISGVEVSDEAIAAAKKIAPHLAIIKGAWPDVVIAGTFDLITCFDVLEHIADDKSALRNIESLLNAGGAAILTMPAFPFLWSNHDTIAHHHRRYTKKVLEQLLRSHTNLEIARISYFNSILFFPIVFFRALKKIFPLRAGASDIFSVPPPLNSALTSLFGAERFMLRYANIPFGVSLLCVVRKK